MERRLAAILAADVVGYSRLVGMDEAGTVAALKRYRTEVFDPKIAQYRGRTVKLMGDGALIEFPSVIDAVTFAVEIQVLMRRYNDGVPEDHRIDFRIGINLGDVIVEADDLYGDGVNVAARLEGLAEPGGICLSRSARDQIRDRLDLDLKDLGEIEVKNIARPVRAFSVILNEKAAVLAATPAEPRPRGRSNWAIPATVSVLALLLLAMVGWWQPWAGNAHRGSGTVMADPMSKAPVSEGPSIAVLPFDTMASGEESRFLAEGIAEDIITELARNVDLTVMARTATFALREKGLDAMEIAEALGVRYALEGSIRRTEGELRIVAQLIDGSTGSHLWAESYDVDASEIYETYDEIVAKIVGTLFSEVRETEKAEVLRRPPDNLDVYELSLRGMALKHRLNPRDARRALADLRKAVEMDPDYAPAWLTLGWVEVIAIIFKWIDGLDYSDLDEATSKIERAISLDPTLASAYQALSLARTVAGDVEGALRSAQRSVELGPGDADNRLFLARALASNGQFENAVSHARHAVALNPFRPSYYDLHLGRALWGVGELEEAGRLMDDCLTKAPGFTGCRVFQVATQMALGNAESAARAVADLRDRSPDFTVDDALKSVGFAGDAKADERLASSLTRAGLPSEGGASP